MLTQGSPGPLELLGEGVGGVLGPFRIAVLGSWDHLEWQCGGPRTL